jgi:hypothetical protein
MKKKWDLEDSQIKQYPNSARERQEYGFIALGVPVGTDEYIIQKVRHIIQDIIESDSALFEQVTKEEPQQAWHFLKSCRSNMAIMHLLRNIKPHLMEQAAEIFDDHVHEMLGLIRGQAPTLPGSFTRMIDQDRISKGGLGLASARTTSRSGYLAASFAYLAMCHEHEIGEETSLRTKLKELEPECEDLLAMYMNSDEKERPSDWPDNPEDLTSHLLKAAKDGIKLQDKFQGLFKATHSRKVARLIAEKSLQIRTAYKDLQNKSTGAFLLVLPRDADSTFSKDQFRSLLAIRYSYFESINWPPYLPKNMICTCGITIQDPHHIFNCKNLNKGNQGATWIHNHIQDWLVKQYKSVDPGARATPQEEEFRIPIKTKQTSSADNALDAEDDLLQGQGIMDIVAQGFGREEGTRYFFDVSVASSMTAALQKAPPTSKATMDFLAYTCKHREKQKESHYGPGLKDYATRYNIPVKLRPLIFDRLGNSNKHVQDFLHTCVDSVAARQGEDNIDKGLLYHRLSQQLSLRIAKAHARSFIFKVHRLRLRDLDQDKELDESTFRLLEDSIKVW